VTRQIFTKLALDSAIAGLYYVTDWRRIVANAWKRTKHNELGQGIRAISAFVCRQSRDLATRVPYLAKFRFASIFNCCGRDL